MRRSPDRRTEPGRPRPLILSVYGSAAVTAVFVALLGWLLAETRDGNVLGLAERLTSSIQTCWPFAVAVALRRTRRPGNRSPLLHFLVTRWCWCPRSGRANHHDPAAPANLPGGQADSDPSRQAIALTGASPSGSAAKATPTEGDPP